MDQQRIRPASYILTGRFSKKSLSAPTSPIPYLFIREDRLRTIPLGLLYFQGAYVTEYRLLFAAIVISFVPTPLLYLVFQRRFIEGITVGAVRG